MKKTIITIAIASLFVTSNAFAYGGGAVGVGFLAPTQTVQSYDYQKSLERQVLELRLIVAKLQLKLMQLHFPHLFK